MIDTISSASIRPAPSAARIEELRDVAERLEASFLSEMLKEAGLGALESEFGGGVGEDQFMSFMRDEHARQVVESGGIGLAETLFQSLLKRETRNA
ncbi:rod-binding protein [Palleronia sp. LCG004]|uniref:rod-binding protein n=1 Tax=Palleronia sp. LCG004 TaxID=3079304 RepID=UPI0029424E20|nr:rod-binding protein [Palleronia sp. LCG004]WOI56205.1 rod-binding protein [Palleronia sp. LCG004]